MLNIPFSVTADIVSVCLRGSCWLALMMEEAKEEEVWHSVLCEPIQLGVKHITVLQPPLPLARRRWTMLLSCNRV